MSDNWVVQNLQNALETWNSKLAEIWQLLTQSPENFKGGAIWNVIVSIHGALQAVGLALLVLFFVVGIMRTCGSLAETKRPETVLKLFIRFALLGFLNYHGMTAEQFLIVWIRSEFLEPKTLHFEANNIYHELLKDTIEAREKEGYKQNDQNTDEPAQAG